MKCTKCGVEFDGLGGVVVTISGGAPTPQTTMCIASHHAPLCVGCADKFCDVLEDWLSDGEPEEEGE